MVGWGILDWKTMDDGVAFSRWGVLCVWILISSIQNIHPNLRWGISVRVHLCLYRYDVDVGCSVRWLGASTMTVQHHLVAAQGPNLQQIYPNLKWGISVRVHLYAHPLHTEVLKHFLYIYDVDVGCSLWQFGASTMMLHHRLVSGLPPIFKTIHPYLKWRISVIGCTHMPIHCILRC